MRRSSSRFTILHGWKDHFTFSRRERRGIALLSLVLCGQCAYLYYLNELKAPILPADRVALERRLAEMEQRRSRVEVQPGRQTDSSVGTSGRYQRTLFPFDPNTLDEAGWQRLGLSPRQAASVVRYRAHGGRFRRKSDLAKVRGIGPERAPQFYPFVLLPDSLPPAGKPSGIPPRGRQLAVELNGADSVMLEALPGIGPGLAGRIIRYRERLGGFVSVEQVREVWGVDDSLYRFITRRLSVDSTRLVRTLRLNSDSLPVFGRHPYVGWKTGRVLINYRKQHGPFQSPEDVRKTGLIPEDILRKLAPYLEADKVE